MGILPAERRILRRGLSDVGNHSKFGRSFGRDAQTGGRDAHPTRDRRVPRRLKYLDRSIREYALPRLLRHRPMERCRKGAEVVWFHEQFAEAQ